ncbi:MAG TPA: hypothetical protein VMZ74_12085 [Ramlibacter sp.]|nr:hypothetical protein [Ramlibacter sp.]
MKKHPQIRPRLFFFASRERRVRKDGFGKLDLVAQVPHLRDLGAAQVAESQLIDRHFEPPGRCGLRLGQRGRNEIRARERLEIRARDVHRQLRIHHDDLPGRRDEKLIRPFAAIIWPVRRKCKLKIL